MTVEDAKNKDECSSPLNCGNKTDNTQPVPNYCIECTRIKVYG